MLKENFKKTQKSTGLLKKNSKSKKKENADMVECDFIWEYPNKKREDI